MGRATDEDGTDDGGRERCCHQTCPFPMACENAVPERDMQLCSQAVKTGNSLASPRWMVCHSREEYAGGYNTMCT